MECFTEAVNSKQKYNRHTVSRQTVKSVVCVSEQLCMLHMKRMLKCKPKFDTLTQLPCEMVM